MQLRNPLFKNMENDGAYDYEKSDCATVKGVFGKTLILVGVAILAAVLAIAFMYNLTEDNIGQFIGLLIGSLFVALIAGLIATFSVTLCPIFSFIYAAAEGFLLGVISLLVELYYPGVAICAVIATFAVTLVMGVLYFTGVIKVGHKLKAFVLTGLIALVLASVISAILAAAGFMGMHDALYGDSPLAWIVAVFGVIIASLSLCLDFDYAANLADGGAPKKYEWKAGFVLTSSIIYLYLRLLELFIRIAAASKK